MKIDLIDKNGTCIAELISNNVEITDAQDTLDIKANCSYQCASMIIIH